MTHKYKPGDWISFTGFRSAGSMNEPSLIIDAIAYQTAVDYGAPDHRFAYVTFSGRVVPEHAVLEVRSKTHGRTRAGQMDAS